MENHAKESIKHKVVLPNSKTINIEGTNFKYEIHYDQLDEKDLLTIEKYANHIFHAYQEKYGLDMNTDHTVKGFIYNSLTDFRSATNLGDGITVYATSNNHRYPHNSGSVAHHDLTTAIYFTLSLYNNEKYGIPPNENHFIGNVTKELKTIKLDDNQEESKKVEPSGPEEEKGKVEEEKSSQENISTETMLPGLNNSDNNQKESKKVEKTEITINQEEPKKIEPSGSEGEEKIKLDEEKIGQEELSPETVLPDLNNLDNNQEESNKVEKTEITINQEEPKKIEPSGSEAIITETMLPNSKTINIEGTKFKYEIHYDQLDEKDLLTIEKYANHIFHAYQERYGLDINTDHTFRGFIYNNLADLSDDAYHSITADDHEYHYNSESIANDLTIIIYFTLSLYTQKNYATSSTRGNFINFIKGVVEELEKIGLDDNQEESSTEERSKTTINQEKQEKELEEQDVLTTTDHPLDDYNHDYHLIG